MKTPQVISNPTEMRAIVDARRREGARIGVVPTMGALHEGHLSLVRKSSQKCDCTVTTIFVNSTQFGPTEDFGRYPRTLDQDLALLTTVGTDFVFCPPHDAMYPPGFSTYVEPPAVSRRLEGEIRPGHFRGVCTVVLKLLESIPANIAFFGQKDFQQALVIQHMARDFNLLTAIEVCPIVRDADGLALSSRNRYLSLVERAKALGLSRALVAASAAVASGEKKAESLRQQMHTTLFQYGVDFVDYVSIADRETLEELESVDGVAVALIAARIGATRLIDNTLVGESVSISTPDFEVKE